MSTPRPLAKIRRFAARAGASLGWAAAVAALALVWAGPDNVRQDWQALRAPAQPYHVQPLASPGWVRAPSRLLDVGQDRRGWSVMRMLLAWREAGLTAEEARALVVALHEFALPTVMGRASEDLEQVHRDRLKELESIVARTRPQAWAALADIGIDTPLSLPDDIASVMVDPSQEGLLEWVALFGEIDLMASPSTGLENPSDPTLAQAMEDLAQATHEVGLKHLQVPLASWGCAPCLSDIALGLRQANADLSAVTGWSGPVLGLDGRVGLTLGVLEQANTDGHERSGQLLELRSDWQDLPHEWFHALDLVMARHAQPFPRSQPISAHPPRPWRWWVGSRAARQWWISQEKLLVAASSWVERRRQFAMGADFSEPSYWTSPTEVLAFAFEHHVRTSPHSTWLGKPPHAGMPDDPNAILAPSPAEQMNMAPLWGPWMFESGQALELVIRPL